MCRLLGVSRSAYYDYEQRRDHSDDLCHSQLLDAVRELQDHAITPMAVAE